MLIEVVVVYNAVNEFAGSDQKIEYTASCFYIPVIDFVISGETSKSDFIWQSFLKHHNKLNWKIYILRDTSQKIAKNPDKEAALEANFPIYPLGQRFQMPFHLWQWGFPFNLWDRVNVRAPPVLAGPEFGVRQQARQSPPVSQLSPLHGLVKQASESWPSLTAL